MERCDLRSDCRVGTASRSFTFLALAIYTLSNVWGCSANESLARERRALVHEGMTQEEVCSALGPPLQVKPGDPPDRLLTWVYVFGTTGEGDSRVVQAFGAVVLIAGTVGTIVAAIFSRESFSGFHSWDTSSGTGTRDSPRRFCRFSVRFGVDGRVSEITDVQ